MFQLNFKYEKTWDCSKLNLHYFYSNEDKNAEVSFQPVKK